MLASISRPIDFSTASNCLFPLGTAEIDTTPKLGPQVRRSWIVSFSISCEAKGKGKTSSNLSPAEAHIAAAAARANGGIQQEPIHSLEDVIESLAPCYTLLRVTMVTILTYTRKPSRFGNATLNHPTFMDASTWQATCLAKSMMRTMHFCYRWNESSKFIWDIDMTDMTIAFASSFFLKGTITWPWSRCWRPWPKPWRRVVSDVLAVAFEDLP